VALVADEGGLAAPLASAREAIALVSAAIEDAGLVPGAEAGVAVDLAATQLLRDGTYELRSEGRRLSSLELVDEVAAWCAEFPVVSVEDPLAEDDGAWPEAARRLRGVQLLGDDRFATSTERLAEGIASEAANAVLVKPNQCGTLTRALDVVGAARRAGWATVVSARSGDTEDAWLADLAVGARAGQVKVGSTMRAERTAKWNRLLRIEAEEPRATFAGRRVLAGR
jgi:enolase